MTYKAVGRSIINYAALVWSPNLHDTNYIKIQCTQNEALKIATGCHKIDHLHTEAEMLKVREHSELLYAQYLARYLEPGNVFHSITTRATAERQMKKTLYTRHRNAVETKMVKNDRKAALQALHTNAVDKAVKSHEMAPNDTAYKRWSCHIGLKLLCILCRTSPPPAMGTRFTVFLGMPAMRTRRMAGAVAHKSG